MYGKDRIITRLIFLPQLFLIMLAIIDFFVSIGPWFSSDDIRPDTTRESESKDSGPIIEPYPNTINRARLRNGSFDERRQMKIVLYIPFLLTRSKLKVTLNLALIKKARLPRKK